MFQQFQVVNFRILLCTIIHTTQNRNTRSYNGIKVHNFVSLLSICLYLVYLQHGAVMTMTSMLSLYLMYTPFTLLRFNPRFPAILQPQITSRKPQRYREDREGILLSAFKT